MLYQLSYIGLLLTPTLTIRVHKILASHPGLHREHRQNCQRSKAKPRIRQSRERQNTKRGVRRERECQSFGHYTFRQIPREKRSGFRQQAPASLTPAVRLNLVHREGFEPSYLARRDRFTVCWL